MEQPPQSDHTSAVVLPLLELPAPCLRSILVALWPDPRDLAAISCCCTATAALCNDQQLWKDVTLRRYGASALPEEAPAPGAYHPTALDGWTFIAGLDASTLLQAEEDKAVEGWSLLQQLADKATKQGCQAFTTQGKLISSCQAVSGWRRTSYRPYQGTYVKNDTAEALDLQQQCQGDLTPWPPVVPGWVYFPSCHSPGYTAKEAHESVARHTTLQSLLDAAARDGGVVAVTTDGETKSKLRPQWCWQTVSSYDSGMYVKADLVSSLQLQLPPPVPDYRALVRKLSSLRVYAAGMEACWLNDQYLTLEAVSPDVGCNGTALKLNNVWWLDIAGVLTGAPPGKYEVVWVMDLPPHYSQYHGPSYSLSATAEPLGLEPMPVSSSSGGSAAVGSAAGPSGPAAGEGSGPSYTPAAAQAAECSSSSGSNSTAAAAGGRLVDRLAALFNNVVDAVEHAVENAVGGGASDAAGSVAASGNSSSSNSTRGEGASGSVTVTMNEQAMRNKMHPTHHWGTLSAGFIHVTEISKVRLRFWSHDDWKSNISWAYAELRPVLDKQQQHHEQQRKQQWEQWWAQHSKSSRPLLRHRLARALNG